VFRDRHYFQREEKKLCVTDLQRRIKIEFVQEKIYFFIKKNQIKKKNLSFKQVQFQNFDIF